MNLFGGLSRCHRQMASERWMEIGIIFNEIYLQRVKTFFWSHVCVVELNYAVIVETIWMCFMAGTFFNEVIVLLKINERWK
jgi:hypothetical protein